MRWKKSHSDLLAALAWALLAGMRLASLLRLPSLLQAGHFVFTLLIPALFILRRPASAQGSRAAFWMAVAVTLLPLAAMRPVGEGLPGMGELIQGAGLVVTLAAILTLNRSFGVGPAHRGLVMRGIYGVVRHPLYAGEMLALLGYCTGYAAGWNWAILAAVLAGQVWRIFAEERLLATDHAYRAYQQRVRWRLVPGLW
jgi:protein-S-isoprenylcysteine O-methyltransferase Ste14